MCDVICSKISIVIPIFNVEKYMDQCIESICLQTYKNLEIILVYDKSEDNSLIKCQQWEKKDSRIILIVNENRKGLGAARNAGLNIASGEYVVFIDSDDWMDTSYIETLYNTIEQTHADYVSGIGYYTMTSKDQISKRTFLPSGEYTSDGEKSLLLLRDAPAVWKRIYKRKWLIDNGLFQPELFHYEDWGFDIPLVFKSQKVVISPPIGMYYRVQREGCLSNDSTEKLCHDFRKSIEFGLQQIGHNGLLESHRKTIQKYLLRDLCIRETEALSLNSKNALHVLAQIKKDILFNRLGYKDIDCYKRHICFGSFSLRCTVMQTMVFRKDLEYFGFSSIISAITPGTAIEITNPNGFRVHQIHQDVIGAFGRCISEIDETTILFIDFLEERNHIIKLEKHQYITESEVYLDSTVGNLTGKKIESDMDDFLTLWEEKCLDLITLFKSKKDYLDIVLIKNRMALQYGDLYGSKEYDQLNELNKINSRIDYMENYFLKKCNNYKIPVKTFNLPEKYNFTDLNFQYGCEPQYMNWALYTELGSKIFDEFNNRRNVN